MAATRLRTGHVQLSPEERDVKALLQALLIRAGSLTDTSERAWNEFCTVYVLRRELPRLRMLAAEQRELAEKARKRTASPPPPKKPIFE